MAEGEISVFDIGNITSSVENTLSFLMGKKVLADGIYCKKCLQWMSISCRSDLSDKYMWFCNVCRTRIAIRSGSFWSRQSFTLQTLLMTLYFFALGISAVNCKKMINRHIGNAAVLQWYQYYRDIMSRYLVGNPIRFGGPGKVVEVDENKFGHKRKYNRGRIPHGVQPWVVGIFERESKKVTLLKVNDRKAQTLIEEIERVV